MKCDAQRIIIFTPTLQLYRFRFPTCRHTAAHTLTRQLISFPFRIYTVIEFEGWSDHAIFCLKSYKISFWLTHTHTHTHTAPEVLIIQGWPLDNPVLRLSWDDIKQPVRFWTWCVLQREFGRIKKRKKPLHWLCEMWALLGFHKTDLPVSWRRDWVLKSLWSAVKSSLILWAQPILYVPNLKGSSKAVSWFNIDVCLILKKISWQAVIWASLWWDQMETDMSLDSVQECFINSNAVSFSSAYMCQQLSFQSSIITHLVRLLWSVTSAVGSCFRLFSYVSRC